jgi:molybdenum cofactor cytidylyltransferase
VTNLVAALGLGERELVGLVGAGGKSTLLRRLGEELARRGHRVVLSTTTHLGIDQVGPLDEVVWSVDPELVAEAAASRPPAFVLASATPSKASGPPPAALDALFADGACDYLVVEADGARRRSLKAPAPHEPVIPSRATMVIVVAGLDAVGRPAIEAAHRPERVAALTGRPEREPLRPEDVAAVLGHPEGGLKGVPASARVAVVLTKAPEAGALAAEVADRLRRHPRIERIVALTAGGHPALL